MSPWETRERGGRYYTRSRKVDGRIVREYVGGGSLGELAALEDERERGVRQEEARHLREKRMRLDALEEPVGELSEAAEVLARAALVVAGYRQHHRGEWRKRRDVELEKRPERKKEAEAYKPEGKLRPLGDVPGLKELLAGARIGDERAMFRLREVLDGVPILSRKLVDPAVQAERHMVRTYAESDPLVKEVLPRTLRSMREELAGPDPPPLERLLVERVVATWLQLQYFEALYVQGLRNGASLAESDHFQKRIDRAQNRHLSAIKTLAQVRKMGPAVQINIAEKQINTAG